MFHITPLVPTMTTSSRIVIICTLIYVLNVTLGLKLGEWRDLAKEGTLNDLVDRKWAFEVKGNTDFCDKRTITLPLDGRSDYTKLMNEKMALLHELGGGTLKLIEGDYLHTSNIVVPSYVCLVGEGMDKTTIKLSDFAPRYKSAGSIRSKHSERITVMRLTVDGNRHNQFDDEDENYGRFGFYSELSNWVYLFQVRVIRHAGYGFDPHGDKKYWSHYLVMDECRAEENGFDGFTIDQTVHATIYRGISIKNDRHGYNVVTGTQMAVFLENEAVNNGASSGVGFGYVAQNNLGFGTNRISFNKCSSCGDFRGAVRLRDVRSVYVDECKFVATDDALCYEISETSDVLLRSNQCVVSRPNRKFKVKPGALFTESDARTIFTDSGGTETNLELSPMCKRIVDSTGTRRNNDTSKGTATNKEAVCVETEWIVKYGHELGIKQRFGKTITYCIDGLPCGTAGHLLRRCRNGTCRLLSYAQICSRSDVLCGVKSVEVSRLRHKYDWSAIRSTINENGDFLELTSVSLHFDENLFSVSRIIAFVADILNNYGLGIISDGVVSLEESVAILRRGANFLTNSTYTNYALDFLSIY